MGAVFAGNEYRSGWQARIQQAKHSTGQMAPRPFGPSGFGHSGRGGRSPNRRRKRRENSDRNRARSLCQSRSNHSTTTRQRELLRLSSEQRFPQSQRLSRQRRIRLCSAAWMKRTRGGDPVVGYQNAASTATVHRKLTIRTLQGRPCRPWTWKASARVWISKRLVEIRSTQRQRIRRPPLE